jgi:hypothetical protein
LEDSSLPHDFETRHPKYKRDKKSGKYHVYGLRLCNVLAHSPQRHEAPNNAESVSGMVTFLDQFMRHPDIDISSGFSV